MGQRWKFRFCASSSSEAISSTRARTVAVLRTFVRNFEQAAVPGVFAVIELRPEPVFGYPSLFAVRIAKAQVPIPNRIRLDLSAPVLVKKNAEAKPIHILTRFNNQVII